MASAPAPGPFPGPPRPRASNNAGVAKGCALGCGGIVLVFVLICAGFGFMLWHSVRAGAAVAQAQATALGRGDAAEVCRLNSPQLQAQLGCEQYISLLSARAPFFAGAQVSAMGMSENSDAATGGHMRLPVTARGPRGEGSLTFFLVKVDGDWKVERVEFPGGAPGMVPPGSAVPTAPAPTMPTMPAMPPMPTVPPGGTQGVPGPGSI